MTKSEKAKQAKNEYMKSYLKQWRQRPGNKEKIQAYQERYWERRFEQGDELLCSQP